MTSLRRFAAWIADWEPFILLLALPLSWSGGYRSLLIVPIVIGVWFARRFSRGRWSVDLSLNRWATLLLISLPLAVLPATSVAVVGRVAVLLNGLALAYGIANRTQSADGLRRWTVGVVLLFAGVLPLASPFVVDWPTYKTTTAIPSLGSVVNQFPQLLHGVIAGTARGGIHSNELAGILVLVLPAALQFSVLRSTWRPVFVLAALLGAMALLFTQSRSGYVAAAAAASVLGLRWLVEYRSRGVPRAASAAAFLAGLAAFLWLTQITATWVISGTVEGGLDSFSSRVEIWQRALLLLTAFPITGVGIGQFSTALHTMAPPVLTPPGDLVVHAHNGYLQAFLDLGIFGAMGVLGIAITSARELFRVAKSDDHQWAMAAFGLGAGLVGFSVYSLTDAIAFPARGAGLLWVIFGIAGAAGKIYPPKASK